MRAGAKWVTLLMGGVLSGGVVASEGAESGAGLTRIHGIRVGHHRLEARPTGCTVILTEGGAVAGVDIRGSAPGTRETALLSPVNTVQQVHAILLSGGSAFGLDAASGVMRYLDERKVGYDVGITKVPIVPAAILFDLPVGDDPKIRPGADCGYRAALAASETPVAEGNVGAGAGATVGKLPGPDGQRRPMKGGLGTAAIELPGGLVVAALVVVNALGDIVDPSSGEVVAGVRDAEGHLADARTLLRKGAVPRPRNGENTTLGVVATNAKLDKSQATKMAQMAQDGLARTIYPAHTQGDGDTVFALSLGSWDGEASLTTIGALAAEVTAEAILRAVREAEALPGYPAVRDLPKE